MLDSKILLLVVVGVLPTIYLGVLSESLVVWFERRTVGVNVVA